MHIRQNEKQEKADAFILSHRTLRPSGVREIGNFTLMIKTIFLMRLPVPVVFLVFSMVK